MGIKNSNANITEFKEGDEVILKNFKDKPIAKIIQTFYYNGNPRAITERIENDSLKIEVHYAHNLEQLYNTKRNGN